MLLSVRPYCKIKVMSNLHVRPPLTSVTTSHKRDYSIIHQRDQYFPGKINTLGTSRKRALAINYNHRFGRQF